MTTRVVRRRAPRSPQARAAGAGDDAQAETAAAEAGGSWCAGMPPGCGYPHRPDTGRPLAQPHAGAQRGVCLQPIAAALGCGPLSVAEHQTVADQFS